MTFGLYSKEKADQIREFVERHDEVDGDQSFENEVTKEPVWFFVKMKENLPGTSEPLANYKQAKAKILKYKYNSDTTLDREVVSGVDDEILITNRTPNPLSSEETVWVRLIGAEYVPFLPGASEKMVVLCSPLPGRGDPESGDSADLFGPFSEASGNVIEVGVNGIWQYAEWSVTISNPWRMSFEYGTLMLVRVVLGSYIPITSDCNGSGESFSDFSAPNEFCFPPTEPEESI